MTDNIGVLLEWYSVGNVTVLKRTLSHRTMKPVPWSSTLKIETVYRNVAIYDHIKMCNIHMSINATHNTNNRLNREHSVE